MKTLSKFKIYATYALVIFMIGFVALNGIIRSTNEKRERRKETAEQETALTKRMEIFDRQLDSMLCQKFPDGYEITAKEQAMELTDDVGLKEEISTVKGKPYGYFRNVRLMAKDGEKYTFYQAQSYDCSESFLFWKVHVIDTVIIQAGKKLKELENKTFKEKQ